MELIWNVLVVIQDCWLWEYHVSSSQLLIKNRNVAIAFAIRVASSLKIVVMIILERAPSFTMYESLIKKVIIIN